MSIFSLLLAHALQVSAIAIYPRSENASTLTGGSTSYGNNTSPTTTGLSYASSCNAAKQSWVSEGGTTFASSTTFETTTSSISISYPTYMDTSTIFDSNNTTPYTLCDGYPRIDGHTNISTRISSVTSTITVRTFATSSAVYANVSAPACSIQNSDCAVLNSSYYSVYDAWTSYRSAALTTNLEPSVTPAPSPAQALPPICGKPTTIKATTILGEPQCLENFASLQLLYWPVSTVSGNLCNSSSGSTVTMAPTISGKPNTYVTWNTTLTSPTVYMAFDGTWVYTSSGSVYSNQSQLLLPQSSTAVSSLCGKIGGGYYPPEAVDYANFNYPVPASAYRCQPRCFINPLSFSYYNATVTLGSYTTETYKVGSYNTYASENLCSTIWNDYAPVLSIPPEFSSLAPAGVVGGGLSCPFLFDSNAVFFDPPKALTQAASVNGVSVPGASATTTTEGPSVTAEPAGGLGPTTPRETGGAQPTAETSTSAYTALPETQGTTSDADPGATQGQATSSPGVGGVIASVLGMTNGGSSAAIGGQPVDPASQIPESGSEGTSTSPRGSTVVVDPVSVTGIAGGQVSGQAVGAVLTGSDGSVFTLTQPSPGGVVVGSVTLAYGQSTSLPGVGNVVAGASGIMAAGTTVPYGSVGSDGTVLTGSDGSVLTVAQPSPGGVVVGSATLAYGHSTSVPGIGDVVAGSSGLIAAGTTVAYSILTGPGSAAQTSLAGIEPQEAVITLGGQAFTANSLSDGVVLENGQTTATVLAGASPVTVGMQMVSAAASGQLVAGSITIMLSPTVTPAAALAFTFDGKTYTADAATDFSIGPGTTLTPGGEVTVSGTTFSLGHSGSYVVVDGVTQTLSPAAGVASGIPPALETSSVLASAAGSSSGSAPGGAATASQSTSTTSDAQRSRYSVGVAWCCVLVMLVLA